MVLSAESARRLIRESDAIMSGGAVGGDPVRVYARLVLAYHGNKGVRLTADEVDAVLLYDGAVERAMVSRAEESGWEP